MFASTSKVAIWCNGTDALLCEDLKFQEIRATISEEQKGINKKGRGKRRKYTSKLLTYKTKGSNRTNPTHENKPPPTDVN